MHFQRYLISWFRENGREFPWRETDDLFHVLVAELMLKRTTTTHVMRVYDDFITDFPTPQAVLNAEKDELMKYLKQLGLQNQRYETLLGVCSVLVNEYDGEVPRNVDELQSIEGIGEYIANATLCFGDGQRLPVIDSNVIRVFSRYFDVDEDDAREKAIEYLPKECYREYNMALLDLGAMICRPQYPKCESCPLVGGCTKGRSRVSSQ